MARKSNANEIIEEREERMEDETFTPPKMLTSKQEVADELKMSIRHFSRLLQKYPFADGAEVPGKIGGRWRVSVDDAWKWFFYVQAQELRHPDSRRMRPEEPPEISGIAGR